jgi:hypothetical protein
MPDCQCENCADAPGATYTEAHRHACEVRHLAGLPTNVLRASFLRGVAKHRGGPAADRLRGEVWALMRARA